MIGILAAILFPVYTQSKVRAKVTRVHSDLRQIGMALEMYREDFGGYPFARLSCVDNAKVDYCEMPRELAEMRYLSTHRLLDPFNKTTNDQGVEVGRTYKYAVIGWQYSNGAKVESGLWIPLMYPYGGECEYYYKQKGRFYKLGKTLKPVRAKPPVMWGVWSVGPSGDQGWTEASSRMFPVPDNQWYPANGKGIIVALSDGRRSP